MSKRTSTDDAEEVNEAWYECLMALGIGRLLDWLAVKLTKEDAE